MACNPLGKVTSVTPKARHNPATTMFSIMEMFTPVRTVPILGTGDTAIQAVALLSAMVLEHSTSLAVTSIHQRWHLVTIWRRCVCGNFKWYGITRSYVTTYTYYNGGSGGSGGVGVSQGYSQSPAGSGSGGSGGGTNGGNGGSGGRGRLLRK